MTVQSDPFVVNISGPANIRTIANIHRELLQALQQNASAALRLDGCEDVDITFVQLVESARRFASATHKPLALSAAASGSLRDALQRGGFLTTAADRSFWLKETGAN